MKIGVSTYSFARRIREGKLTQLDCIKAAKEMGFDTIDIQGLQVPEGSSPAAYAQQLSDACETFGLPVASYTVDADLLNGCGGDTKAEIARLKGEVDIARLLGAATLRHDATAGYPPSSRQWRGFDDVLPTLADACREITRYAQLYGIRTMVENHGFFVQDSHRIEKLVNRVAHENFGVLADLGNFLCVDEDPATAVGRVAPYVFHVHVKDFHVKSGQGPDPGDGFFRSRGGNYLRGAIIGHGDVPVRQCLSILKSIGYDGVLCVEFEGLEEPEKALSIGLCNLRRYLSEA